MEPVIRMMRRDEADAVAMLLLRANQENLAAFPEDVARTYRRELLDTVGRAASQETLVLHLAGRLAGSVAFLPDATRDGHTWPPGGSVLRFLAVEPEDRGLGLGERLVRVCITRAEARGSGFLALHTAPGMHAARHLYETLGFERSPEHDFDPAAHYGQGPRPGEAPWGLAYLLRLAAAAG